MTRYRFSGPMPGPGPDGDLVHPGDERELADAPDCPPWEPLEDPAPEAPAPAKAPKPAKQPAPAASLTGPAPKET